MEKKKKYRARDFVSKYKYNKRNKNEKTTTHAQRNRNGLVKAAMERNPENKMGIKNGLKGSNIKHIETDREGWMTKCKPTRFLEV